MEIKTKYNIGDVVKAYIETSVKKECPVCKGKGQLTAYGENGEKYFMRCPRICVKGFIYKQELVVKERKLYGIKIKVSKGFRNKDRIKISYSYQKDTEGNTGWVDEENIIEKVNKKK